MFRFTLVVIMFMRIVPITLMWLVHYIQFLFYICLKTPWWPTSLVPNIDNHCKHIMDETPWLLIIQDNLLYSQLKLHFKLLILFHYFNHIHFNWFDFIPRKCVFSHTHSKSPVRRYSKSRSPVGNRRTRYRNRSPPRSRSRSRSPVSIKYPSIGKFIFFYI